MSHLGAIAIALLGITVGGTSLAYMHLIQPARVEPPEGPLFLQSAAAASPAHVWPRSGAVPFYTEWLQLGSAIANTTESRVASSASDRVDDAPPQRRRTMRRRVQRDTHSEEARETDRQEGRISFRCLDERCRMKRVERVPVHERKSRRGAHASDLGERRGFVLFQNWE